MSHFSPPPPPLQGPGGSSEVSVVLRARRVLAAPQGLRESRAGISRALRSRREVASSWPARSFQVGELGMLCTWLWVRRSWRTFQKAPGTTQGRCTQASFRPGTLPVAQRRGHSWCKVRTHPCSLSTSLRDVLICGCCKRGEEGKAFNLSTPQKDIWPDRGKESRRKTQTIGLGGN